MGDKQYDNKKCFKNRGWYITPFEITDYDKYTAELKKYSRFFGYRKCRYLFSYISQLYEKDTDGQDAYIKVYDLPDDEMQMIKNTIVFPQQINGRDDNGDLAFLPYDLTLNTVRIMTFKNDIGLLIMDIGFNDMTIEEIADFTNTFKKMGNLTDNKNLGEKEKAINDKHYGTQWKIIQNILASNYVNPFFFASKYDNYESFVMLSIADHLHSDGNEYSRVLSRLKNGLRSNVDTSNFKEMESVEISEYSYIRFGASQNAFVCLIDKDEGYKTSKKFINEVFSQNIEQSYFPLYMLLLNQRLMLLLSMYKSMNNKDNIKVLRKIQKDLIQFKMVASFNIVSNTSIYQCVYDKVYEVLRIDRLYKDVDEINQRIVQENESDDTKRESVINFALAGLSVLSIFSAVVDFSDFWQQFRNGDYNYSGAHITAAYNTGIAGIALIMSIVTIIILSGVMYLRKLKRPKSEKHKKSLNKSRKKK